MYAILNTTRQQLVCDGVPSQPHVLLFATSFECDAFISFELRDELLGTAIASDRFVALPLDVMPDALPHRRCDLCDGVLGVSPSAEMVEPTVALRHSATTLVDCERHWRCHDALQRRLKERLLGIAASLALSIAQHE